MSLQRPAYLQHRGAHAAISAKFASGLGVAQPPRISLKDDRFTLIMANGDKHPTIPASLTLDVIAVGANAAPSKVYYDGDYDPGDAMAPICWSDNGVAPSERAGTPQSETCALCPRAIWGSKISKASGAKVQECATYKKVAVIVAGAGDTVFLLQIPPASLKPWRNYIAHLQNLDGTEATEVVTRVSMESKTLGFEPVDFLPKNLLPFVDKVINSEEPAIVTGERDRPRQATQSQAALPAPVTADTRQITHSPEQRQEVGPGPSFVAPTAPIHEKVAAFGAAAPVAPQHHPAAMQQEPAAPQPTDMAAQIRELEAKLAAMTGGQAQQPATTEPVRRRRAAPRTETVVGPGPIPPTTFLAPGTPEPVKATPPFGVSAAPPPPPAGVQDALNKAFGLG